MYIVVKASTVNLLGISVELYQDLELAENRLDEIIGEIGDSKKWFVYMEAIDFMR